MALSILVAVSSKRKLETVKIGFIYHVSYGSLLVRCHRVVDKGRLLSPSSWLRFLCLHLRRALCLPINRTRVRTFVAPYVCAFVAPCVWHSLPLFAHPILHLLKETKSVTPRIEEMTGFSDSSHAFLEESNCCRTVFVYFIASHLSRFSPSAFRVSVNPIIPALVRKYVC